MQEHFSIGESVRTIGTGTPAKVIGYEGGAVVIKAVGINHHLAFAPRNLVGANPRQEAEGV